MQVGWIGTSEGVGFTPSTLFSIYGWYFSN